MNQKQHRQNNRPSQQVPSTSTTPPRQSLTTSQQQRQAEQQLQLQPNTHFDYQPMPLAQEENQGEYGSDFQNGYEDFETQRPGLVRGRKYRHFGSTFMLPDASQASLHAAFNARDGRQSWLLYKELYRYDRLGQLQPDDHTTLLGFHTTYHLPHLAARFASRVAYNMRKLRIPLDHRDYHCLMLCHLRNKNDVARIMKCFQDMQIRDGLKPDVRAYCILIASLGRAGKLRAALETYEDMCEQCPGSSVDIEARALVIEAYGYAHDLEGAEHVFADSIALPNAEYINGRGLSPTCVDRRIWEAMIRAYAMSGRLDDALRVFRSMDGGPSSPVVEKDLETFDAVIQACEVSGDLDTAWTIWNELKEWSRQRWESRTVKTGEILLGDEGGESLSSATTTSAAVVSRSASSSATVIPTQDELFEDPTTLPVRSPQYSDQMDNSYNTLPLTTEALLSKHIRPKSGPGPVAPLPVTYTRMLHILSDRVSSSPHNQHQFSISSSSSSPANLSQTTTLDDVLCMWSEYRLAHGIPDSPEAFEYVIEAQFRVGDVEGALEWFDGMAEWGFPADFDLENKCAAKRAEIEREKSRFALQEF
ncbi:hypothetical protein HK102_009989 [Quaeritorhiza haematococci]|nr:hypothetical protein HK102_009989 [Quaeritorhiza haematococci]